MTYNQSLHQNFDDVQEKVEDLWLSQQMLEDISLRSTLASAIASDLKLKKV